MGHVSAAVNRRPTNKRDKLAHISFMQKKIVITLSIIEAIINAVFIVSSVFYTGRYCPSSLSSHLIKAAFPTITRLPTLTEGKPSLFKVRMRPSVICTVRRQSLLRKALWATPRSICKCIVSYILPPFTCIVAEAKCNKTDLKQKAGGFVPSCRLLRLFIDMLFQHDIYILG